MAVPSARFAQVLAALVAAFATMTTAAQPVVAIRCRPRPSMLELMDRSSIRAVEEFRPLDLDTSTRGRSSPQQGSTSPDEAVSASLDEAVQSAG